MHIVRSFLTLVLIQIIFISVFIVTLTAIRFFDAASFEKMKEIYVKYAEFNTSISYVYDGDNG